MSQRVTIGQPPVTVRLVDGRALCSKPFILLYAVNHDNLRTKEKQLRKFSITGAKFRFTWTGFGVASQQSYVESQTAWTVQALT